MARTKEVTVGGQQFLLQSVSPRWYLELSDRCGHGEGRNTRMFIDEILRNVVISPPEVGMKGIEYFNDDDDIGHMEELFSECNSFLKEPAKRVGAGSGEGGTKKP